MKYRWFVLVGIFFSGFYYSQTEDDITLLKNNYQKCLDKGEAMHVCSYNFYDASDVLLNEVYKKLYAQQNDVQKKELKREQKRWLSERDIAFKKNYSNAKKDNYFEEGSKDFRMVVIGENANFVLERVQVLIKRKK